MNITIEVSEPGDQALFHGDSELWITVTGSDPLPDYTTIRRLAQEQTGRTDLNAAPSRYFPAWAGPGEPYQELWVTRKAAPVETNEVSA